MLDDLKEFLKEIGNVEGKYLVSCFYQDDNWKVDFFDSKEHKIYTYTKVEGKIVINKDDIFQKENKELEVLDIEKIKIGKLEALDKLSDPNGKMILILQVIDSKVVWNITIITPEFNILNTKINAENGEILNESKESIFSFKKSQ
ncbi:hypothetical protein HN681_02445 [archaeon]|jgi:hypothetical protein|nr:hypothetical protein [archaeon]MBT3731285.1 hypothetical protein [archaeon]MBT4669938.1 hypothetical protein [archaeon]MBT5029763.1 hypothetical protein [archaeon]MBT5287488.1 hypothetical protein [archaeon]